MNNYFKMLAGGYCHVLEDRIVLCPTDDLRIYRTEADIHSLQKKGTQFRGILYPIVIFLTLTGFYFGIQDMIVGEIISSLLFLGMGIVLLRILLIYLLSNPTLMIKRDKIISIKYQKEITWLGIWPMFIIKFNKENGRTGRKLIVLKYTLSEYGKEVADHALNLMKQEGLLNS